MDSSHQYPAARSASVSGSGNTLIQRSKNTLIGPRPEPVAERLQRGTVITTGEPVGQGGESIPALTHWRLAHSWPLTHTLTGYGK